MPDDPRESPLQDVIFDYDHIPTSSPLTHPVIRGSGDPVREKDHPDSLFQRPENVKINISGTVINNTLSTGNGVYVTWTYPELNTHVYDDLGISLGISPLTPASVAYELRILDGTFSESDINTSSVFGVEAGSSQQSEQQHFPGLVVFDQFINLASPSEPIWLTRNSSGRADITDGVLEAGRSYTVIIRHLFWTQAFSTDETSFDHYLSQYSISTFSVNQPPSVSSLRINDLRDPTISSDDDITFSFVISDPDGPRTIYQIEAGFSGSGPFGVYDSGEIVHPESFSEAIRVDHKIQNSNIFTVGAQYRWRVSAKDGLSDGETTDGTDTFTVNSPPRISSLTADGNQLLFGNQPKIKNENVVISWILDDAEDDAQQAYVLTLSAGGEDFLNTGIVRSSLTSVTVPTLPDDKEVTVSVQIRDGVEFGSEYTGVFVTNSPPRLTGLLVDGSTNPGDVSGTTPVFSWTFVDNNPSDIQSYFRIQVAEDDDFSTLVWDTGDAAGATSSVTYGSTSSPAVSPGTLAHEILYYFRARVSDGISWSEYSTGFFSVNTAPGNPTLTSPSSGSYSGIITVTWAPAGILDADGDDITYSVEITSTRSFSQGWELLAGPLASTINSYEFDLSDTPAGDNYGIRVMASDGFAESDPSSGGTSPRFTIANHAPNSPTIIYPKEGDLVNKTLRVEWVEANPVDVDGDRVVYKVEATSASLDTTPIWDQLATLPEGETKLLVDVSEYVDGSDYKIRIRALDSRGEPGAYVYSGKFSISNSIAVNDFEKLKGSLYLGSSDGRIFKALETIWQVDEDWNQQRGSVPFRIFVRGEPEVGLSGGKLVISPSKGTTYLLRHSEDR